MVYFIKPRLRLCIGLNGGLHDEKGEATATRSTLCPGLSGAIIT